MKKSFQLIDLKRGLEFNSARILSKMEVRQIVNSLINFYLIENAQ